MKVGYLYLTFSLFLGSCTYDKEEDFFESIDCKADPVSYTNHIEPILKANCAITGCHVAGSQFPDLTDFSLVQDYGNMIKLMTTNRTMPPTESGINLKMEEVNQISCWVDSGALNN